MQKVTKDSEVTTPSGLRTSLMGFDEFADCTSGQHQITNYYKMTPEMQHKYRINTNVNLAFLGDCLNDALDYVDMEDTASAVENLRDIILTMHGKVFPNAWTVREPTTEETRTMRIDEAKHDLNSALTELTGKTNIDVQRAVELISGVRILLDEVLAP